MIFYYEKVISALGISLQVIGNYNFHIVVFHFDSKGSFESLYYYNEHLIKNLNIS